MSELNADLVNRMRIEPTLSDCEHKIERAMFAYAEAGDALRTIRDHKLYKDSHKTFEAYCRDRWNWSRVHAHRMIEAGAVHDSIYGARKTLPTGNTLEPPRNERAARELAPLRKEPKVLTDVWVEVVEKHGPDATARQVKNVVAEVLPKPVEEEPPPLPEGTYSILYADPPWRYEQPGGQTPEIRAVENHYPTMSIQEIAGLAIPAASDAVLFLWATNPLLTEALTVMEAWGFQYRTNACWVKDRFGMGYYVRGQHELLLIGRRGQLPVPEPSDRPASVVTARRQEHSQKPDDFYDLIEGMYPEHEKVELFARRPREGWASWGNQLAEEAVAA